MSIQINKASYLRSLTYHPGYASGRYYPYLASTTSSNRTITAANLNVGLFYISTAKSFDRLAINVTGSSPGNTRIGIYDCLNGFATNLIVDIGIVPTNTTGFKEFITNLALNPGCYAFAALSDNNQSFLCADSNFYTTSIIGSTTLSSTAMSGYRVPLAYGNLPQTAPSTGLISITNTMPIFWLRAA